MSKFTKTVASVGLSLTTAIWLSGAAMIIPVASATTAAELQALITQMLAQIQVLQAQLNATQGATSSYNFTRDLTVGSKGDDVKTLQQWLNANGYTVATSGAGSAGNETTYFGPATKAALAKYQAAKGVTPAAGYFGPKTRAALVAAPGVPVVPGVVVPATGITVSLAADTPLTTAVPKSAANVSYLKFNVAGNGTINQIVIKRVGAGATTDFASVYLYDGSTRLTSGRSVNSSTHEVSFTSLNIVVSGVKTLTISADIAAAPGAGNRNAFQVTTVVAGTVTVSGLPITGNSIENTNASAGTLVIEKTGSVNNPNIGAVSAKISQFRMTPASEDAKVSRISLYFAGSLSKTNISNFVLKDEVSGNTLATASGVNAKDLVVFEFATPYTILKGDNKIFGIYADISGIAKSGDTLKLYVDEASDIYAIGAQYGQGVGITKTLFSSTDTDAVCSTNADNAHFCLTLQGGTFTISFIGPNTGDIAKNGKDVSLYEFSLYSAVNVEVRKLTASIAFAALGSNDEALADVKVVDKTTGLTVAGPLEAATGNAGVAFTDYFTINAGQTRTFKITADIPNTWDNLASVTVTLGTTNSFGASDLKNLDNNTFLTPATDITPSGVVTGNKQTVKAPTLTVGLNTLPVSDGYVKGKQKASLVGVSLRATADSIKVTSIKVSASATLASGTIANMKADFQSLGLYEGDTLVSTLKSLEGTAAPIYATFSNLNYTIPKGETKVLVVKANISASAFTETSAASSKGAKYGFGIADVADTTAVDVSAVDSNGNEPVYSGDLVNTGTESAIDSPSVVITVLPSGSLTVAKAPADSESKAGILVAGTLKTVLGKFTFTAASEDLTVKKLNLHLDNDATSATDATAVLDEFVKVYLYDGASTVGSAAGYVADATGLIAIEGLEWLVPKTETTGKTLTVKADLNTMALGADTGTEIQVQVVESGFEAAGTATTLTTLTGAPKSSNEKVVYKTYPTLETVGLGGGSSMSGTLGSPTDLEVARFRVRANTAGVVEWGEIGLQMGLLNATFADSALTIWDMTNNQNVPVATQAPSTTAFDLANDATKSVILHLTTVEQIGAGSERIYAVKIAATTAGGQFGTANETETLTTRLILHNDSSTANIVNALARGAAANAIASTGADVVLDSSDNAFVWSDYSAASHSGITSDWANGVYIDTFPSAIWTLTR